MATISKIQKTRKDFLNAVEYATENNPQRLTLVSTRNLCWGYTWSAKWHGERVGYAGGCGYDKQSAALADGINVHGGGAGIDMVIFEAAKRNIKIHRADEDTFLVWTSEEKQKLNYLENLK